VNTFKIGFYRDKDAYEFAVWAPFRDQVELILDSPAPIAYPMQNDPQGYWRIRTPFLPDHSADAVIGSRYYYRLDAVHAIFDSAAPEWGGPGSSCPEEVACDGTLILPPYSVTLFEKTI